MQIRSKQDHLLRGITLTAVIIGITVLHYLTSADLPIMHDFLRRLYYLPIIYAAFVFGVPGGLLTALGISLVFLPHVFHSWGHITLQTYDALFEIIIFFVVATTTGTLVELEQKKHAELLALKEQLTTALSKSLKEPRVKKAAIPHAAAKPHFETLIGESSAMQAVYDLINKVKDTDINVLILGESGTGKELVAQALHKTSKRKAAQFVAINCAAIPETLLESELFGYVRGAFTGADTNKPGKFQLADLGTLFLDEIGTLPLELQAKLLRVIQDGEVTPLGGTMVQKVNVRLIAATNETLEEKIKKNQFRADLYYRLNVVSIDLPALRQRKEDIPLLVQHFLKKYGGAAEIATDTLQLLELYNWPGNIRELENVVQRAVALNQNTMVVPADLPAHVSSPVVSQPGVHIEIPDNGLDIETLEKELLVAALRKTNNNQTKAAKLLGLSRPALIYRLEKYQLK